jgi:hypothetical protein
MQEHRGPVAWSRGADVASSGPNRFLGLRRFVAPAVLLLLLLACSRSAPRADAFVSDSSGTDDRISSCSGPNASGPDCTQSALVAVRQRVAYLGFAASALLGLAGIAWFVRVRAEVRALSQPAFLVMPRIDEGLLPIAGAEPDRAGIPRDLVRSGFVGDVGPPVVGNGVAPPFAAPAPARPRYAHPGPARTQEMALGPAADGQPLLFSVSTARSAMEPVQAADATLQFLPGRLVHALGGKSADIRFVRQPGPATVVTLGRQEGPAGRHVQLVEPTVSRLHARMRYSGGRWTIGNLSQTNPLRVNGRALGSAAETHMLSDGDRVAVGELVLVFRER